MTGRLHNSQSSRIHFNMNEVVFVQNEKTGSDVVFGEEKDASLRGAEYRSS